MTDFIVVGDVAYLPEEWAALERKRERDRAYQQRPEVKARRAAYMREYRRRNRDRWNAYQREWMRRYRARRAA